MAFYPTNQKQMWVSYDPTIFPIENLAGLLGSVAQWFKAATRGVLLKKVLLEICRKTPVPESLFK